MIKIEAVVRPERVNLVVEALEGAGCKGYHLFNIHGRGQQRGVEIFTGRGADTAIRTALPKTLIVTVVPEEEQERVIEAIIHSARSSQQGEIGDGKIFVTPVSEVIRVRTGERGGNAI